MSILQEYEEIRKKIGREKFDAIDKYLKKICPQKNYAKYEKELKKICRLPYEQWIDEEMKLRQKYKIIFLSDILYKNQEWDKYEKRFNEEYKNRKIEILGTWDSDFDDIRCNAILYQNNEMIANVIVSYDKKDLEEVDDKNINEKLQLLIYSDFDKYTTLPKISKCSKLLQQIYDDVCYSESSMCHIDEEDWDLQYSEDYTEDDINELQMEIIKYHLNDVIGIDDGEYKIVGYGDLETRFNDDRKINKSIEDSKNIEI